MRHLLQIITPPSPPDAPTAAQLPGPDDSPSSSALPQASQAAPGNTSWITQQPATEVAQLQQVPKSQQLAVPSSSQQAQHLPNSADRPGWRGWVEAALDSSTPQSLPSSDTASASDTAHQLTGNSLQKGSSEALPEGHMAAAHLQGSSAGQLTPPHHPSSLQSSPSPHVTTQLSSWQDQQSLPEPTSSQQPETQSPLSHQQHSQHLAATAAKLPKPEQEAAGWDPPKQQLGVAAGGLPEQFPALSRDKLKLIREACHVVMTLAERQGRPEMLLPVLEGMQQVHSFIRLSVCPFRPSSLLTIHPAIHPAIHPSICPSVHASKHGCINPCVVCAVSYQPTTHSCELIKQKSSTSKSWF